MSLRRARPLAFLAALLVLSCTHHDVRTTPEFEAARAGGYRIAVVPFEVTAEKDGWFVSSVARLGNLLSLEGGAGEIDPEKALATLMRRAFVSAISQGPIRVMELWVCDTELTHHGLEGKELFRKRNALRIAEALEVDGVLYGEVFRWNRHYYVAESVQSVGLRLELIDRTSRRSIFWAERIERKASGLTGGPTGQISVAVEPIKGLKTSLMEELTRSVTRNLAAEFTGLMAEEMLEAPRIEEVPMLSFASIVSRHAGALRAGEQLTVVAVGSANSTARFDIGRYQRGIPMRQVAVTTDPRGDRGSYVGIYTVQPGERIGPTPIYVSLCRRTDEAACNVRRILEPLVRIEAGGPN